MVKKSTYIPRKSSYNTIKIAEDEHKTKYAEDTFFDYSIKNFKGIKDNIDRTGTEMTNYAVTNKYFDPRELKSGYRT